MIQLISIDLMRYAIGCRNIWDYFKEGGIAFDRFY